MEIERVPQSNWVKLKESWRVSWGLWIFSLSTLASFIGLFKERHWAHYRIFTGAAEALWQGRSPHYDHFGTHLGYWFYSPSNGMFFYGPFLFFPPQIGILIYMAVSAGVFLLGVLYFTKVMLGLERMSWMPHRHFNWFWFWISFQTMGAIMATKLELIMIGLMFFIGAWLIERRRLFWSAFLMAMMTNWKFQPLPVLGLLGCVLFWSRDGWRPGIRFVAYFAASLAFWFALPVLWLGYEKLSMISVEWRESLQSFVSEAWVDFDHLLRLPMELTGWRFEYRQFQIFSLICGLVLAILISVMTIKAQRVFNSLDALKWSILAALCWGTWFILGLSPLSQGNGYVFYAPILLLAILLMVTDEIVMTRKWKLAFWIALAVNGFLNSILYSDIFGKTSRVFFNSLGVKPYGITLLAVVVTIYFFARMRPAHLLGKKSFTAA
jgi:hypothetical protein